MQSHLVCDGVLLPVNFYVGKIGLLFKMHVYDVICRSMPLNNTTWYILIVFAMKTR